MKMKRRFWLSVAATALFSAVSYSVPSWAGGTLTLTLPAMPTGYPIVSSAGLADIIVGNVVFEGLARWKKDTLQVEPALATSWTPNEDSSVWTFELRDGVKWHDGQPFTAEDVKFTFDLLLDKTVRSASAGQVASLKSVEVVSPRQVKMTFDQPNASLPIMLAYRMPIVPKHLLEGKDANQPAEFIAKPIGTGAFRFSEAASGQFWNTERNPDWWGGNVDLDEVVFKIMADANSAVAQLRAGNTDVALVRPQQISALQGWKVTLTMSAIMPTIRRRPSNCCRRRAGPKPAGSG
jgi:peptide/nickel transport system substrate-binding protein